MDPQVDPVINQTLGGRLRVLRRIGEGGMGTVYVAEHIGLGKQVAVKVLNAQYAGQSDVVSRLHSEARHAAAIHNEHIVDVFDIGATDDGRPFVVMELLQGESLAERLRRCRVLSETDTLHIGRQLASALAVAHKSGIVHRDIKPENIFLCPRDSGDFVKVLDFGISKAAPNALASADGSRSEESGRAPVPTIDPRLTRTGAVLGTPLYMSPEQVRGETLDHRVDIYALGVVLYECLTGTVPFLAPSYLAVVAKILTEAPERPSVRSPERALPAALEQIVLRAMAHDRAVRYPTMDTLLEDLERYAAGRELLRATWLPGQAAQAGGSKGRSGDSPPERPGSSLFPVLPLVPILTAAAVVLGVGLLLTLWRGPQPTNPAARPAVPASGPAPASDLPARPGPAAPIQPQRPAPPEIAAAPPETVAARPPELADLAALAPEPKPAAPTPVKAPNSPPAAKKSPQATQSSEVTPLPQPLLEEQAPNPFLIPSSKSKPK